MSDRPVFSSELGEFFQSLRIAKGWKQSQAADLAKRRGLLALSYNALRYLEEGKTKHPDRRLLQAAATLYELPFELLVSRYVEAQYEVKLVPARSAGRKSLPQSAPATPFDRDERKILDQYRRLAPPLRRAVSVFMRQVAASTVFPFPQDRLRIPSRRLRSRSSRASNGSC